MLHDTYSVPYEHLPNVWKYNLNITAAEVPCKGI